MLAAAQRDVIALIVFFFQAEDGIRDYKVTGVQTCALPIYRTRITVPATASVASAIIPITGLYSAGAEPYGGQYISHVQVSRGQTITLPVMSAPPVAVSSLRLNPTSVTGGKQSSTGTVTLSGPAPAGGAQVTLSSSNAAASVPSTVTVRSADRPAGYPI